jgi:hypothetical protein
MKVFIHSSSKDIDIVQDLAHRLEAAGIETHWANELAKSDKTISVTNRALREADEILVILTNESVDDPKSDGCFRSSLLDAEARHPRSGWTANIADSVSD